NEFHFILKINPERLDWVTGNDSLLTYYKTVQIGIPYSSKAEISYAQGSHQTLLNKKYIDTKKLSSRSYPLVKISQPFTVRDRQLVSLQIFPITGNSIYREIDVKVKFSESMKANITPGVDPYFNKIFKASVANYEQFKNWGIPASAFKKSFSSQAGPFSGVSSWYRIELNQNGLYKITGAQLEAAGISLNNLQSSEIHLYNGGGMPLEVANEKPRPIFQELSLIVEDGGDGIFHRNDYFLFYGESQNRWVYSLTDGIRYINNSYYDRNVYWLTVSNANSGLRMAADDYTGSIDTTITSYFKSIHMEQDNMLNRSTTGKITDYYNWYWTDENQLTFFISIPGIVSGDTADIKLSGRTLDTTGSLDNIGYMDLYINGVKGLNKFCNQFKCTYRSTSLIDGSNQVKLDLWSNSNAPPYFDYLELFYNAENIPVNNKLDLTIGSSTGLAAIEVIDNFSQLPFVLDISQPLNPSIISGATESNGILTFYADLDPLRFNRYYLCTPEQMLTPLSIKAVSTTDLYTAFEQTDLMIIASSNLVTSMDEYVNYRQADGYAIKVYDIKDIMDNFSFGLYDPIAIRDFLKYAYENFPAPAPMAVLLVGDGSFDFLDRLSTGMPNFIPPFIHPTPFDDVTSSDDNYVYFGKYGLLDSDTSYNSTNRGLDMIISRWPVRTSSEIATITDKIKRYESSGNFGSWKSNITLVADDEFGTFDNETIHTTQTEFLEKNYVPAFFKREKIYLWEYPFVNRDKPEVNDAIVKAINDGTLLINYVGHGNPDVWAHEHVFNRGNDLPRLNNIDRLPLVYAASCAIGFFDNPQFEGMAEDLLSMTNGGAIGVISAARLVYSSASAAFNRKVYEMLLYNDSLSICEAMFAAKLQRQYIINTDTTLTIQKNDRAYLFFGDPFIKLGIPELDIEFTSVPDSLIALNKTIITGRVVDEQGIVYSQDGVLSINVYDSEREKTYRLVNSNGVITEEVDYTVTGPSIYRGTAAINSGQFDFEFIPPLDIGFGGQGARILVYAKFNDIDGTGSADSINISKSIVNVTDTIGPVIEITLEGINNFTSGDIISSNEQLLIKLSDPSGINLAGGLGHGINLEIDNKSENIINLTNLFNNNQDDFTIGSLVFTLENLAAGEHHFKIKVWDNANNSSQYEFDAEVISSEKLVIQELLNYPNPMNESTRFSFYLTQVVDKFTLEIFTLSGKKIRSFNRYSLNPGYYDDIIWYGRDFDGDRIASQVYIYKATAYPVNGEAKVESFGKLIILN
ncbi:MAG: type IX secretion system sortase PorU, partial [Candidatus Zixiibacteriota bacterium]